MKNSDQPVFAVGVASDHDYLGLTKREYFAATAVRGLLGTQAYGTITPQEATIIAYNAVNVADALLEALEKTATPNT